MRTKRLEALANPHLCQDSFHPGTFTRNTMRVVTNQEATFDLLATPTPTQRSAFELLCVAIPRTQLLPELSDSRKRIP